MLPRIFDLFFRVDGTLERSQGGLGIGLSLVRRLVELHNGTVTVRSNAGTGTEFTVRLPIEVASVVSAGQPVGTNGQGAPVARRILVVDDMRDAAESLALVLRLKGNDVMIAHDGLDAVEAAERFRPHVVLLDIGMPKLNGFEACARIRKQPWGREMVLIALTGWGQSEDRRRTHEAGFDAHLVKPVDLDVLSKQLDALSVDRNAPDRTR
jgi:CheY-like chemotaxis protein